MVKQKRTPRAHRFHVDEEKPCGCWTGREGEATIVHNCGATYLVSEVASFPLFRCYDCAGGFIAAALSYLA